MSSSEDEYHAKSDKVNPLPYKSKERYIATYDNFITWQNERNITSFSENILITYFEEISTKYKPPSLWAIYSMLKNTLKSKHNINLEGYVKLSSYLRKQSNGYVGKKAKVLTAENVEKFIDLAPDDKYLVIKVALILGVTGGLRSQELSRITVDQIENHGEMCLVTIPNSESKLPRTFVIQGKYYNIMKRYQNLRSRKCDSNRFFQHYRNGKCTSQVMGKNRFGNMPKEIAEFLKLPDANLYTGHTFRRTSTSLLGDGGDLATKRQKPSKVDVPERAEPDCSESTRAEVSGRPIRPIKPLEQCCFCGEFSKKYVNIVHKPYIDENRTTIAFNNINVELDFNEAQPKSACLTCDTKLRKMLDFVKLVKLAQDTLRNVETKPIDVVIVKNEYESKDEDDNKDEIDDEMDSLALCQTVYENESVNRKRKSNSDTSERKYKVTKKSEDYELWVEVKPEPVEHNDSTIELQQDTLDNESVNSDLINDVKDGTVDYDGNKEMIDTGTEVKSSEAELATNAFVNAICDDNS